MLQDFFEQAGKYSCLAQCYIYAVLDYMRLNNGYRDVTMATTLLSAYNNCIGIDKEFFVENPVKLIKEVFKTVFEKDVEVDVVKRDITTFKDLPFEQYSAVRFDYNGHSHWVLAKGQTQIYNSLSNSQCVRLGKPVTARVITINESKAK